MAGERDVNINITARDRASETFRKVGRAATELFRDIGAKGARGEVRALAILDSDRVVRAVAALGALRLAAGAVNAAMEAARGGAQGFISALERLPFGLGSVAQAIHAISDELTGWRAEAERLDRLGTTQAAILGGAAAGTAGRDAIREVTRNQRIRQAQALNPGKAEQIGLEGSYNEQQLRLLQLQRAAKEKVNAEITAALTKNADALANLPPIRRETKLIFDRRSGESVEVNNDAEVAKRERERKEIEDQMSALRGRLQSELASIDAETFTAFDQARATYFDELNAINVKQAEDAKKKSRGGRSDRRDQPDLVARDASLLSIAAGGNTRAEDLIKKQVKTGEETVRTLRDILTELRNQQPGGSLNPAPGI